MTKILRNGLIAMMLTLAGFALVMFFRIKMAAE